MGIAVEKKLELHQDFLIDMSRCIITAAEEETDAPIDPLLPKMTTESAQIYIFRQARLIDQSTPKIVKDRGSALGFNVAQPISRPLSDGKDSEAMLQAKQTMMTETPIRKETNAVHRTTNNDMRTLVTKLGPKDGKKNKESANSVKSRTSKVAVPEVIIVTSSDENLFDASADMDKRTKIEQQSKQNRKMNAVTSTIETGNERKSAASDSLPIPINKRSKSPRKSSRVQIAAIRVT